MNPTQPNTPTPDYANLQGSAWVVIPEVHFTQFLESAHNDYLPDKDAWIKSTYSKMNVVSFHEKHAGRFILLTEEFPLEGDNYALSIYDSLDWAAYEALALQIAADAAPHYDATWRQLACESLHELVLKNQVETVKSAARAMWQHFWKQVQEAPKNNPNTPTP